ncbi:response regulator transcription factor [Provencibacterium massiliense]|uniref:response regulator transcription factor n=1 Tax=Provencibacterium massiliense TaxID=1841868 RepID=UPI0009A83955|nr:response regulator transcription factor [Provencibacterium massiliense]
MANILVVEDEVLISELIRRNLSLVGHGCDPAFDGDEALEKLSGGRYDLMILDVMLPKRDGFAVMGEAEGLPTIFLTARDGLNERITGFSLGADDYIVKPFEMLELLARVEAVLRRTQKHAGTFELDQARVDFGSRQVYRGDALLELVWGYDFEGESRTVDVHIQKLRRKLGWEERIKTVYKLGYRLEAHG